MITIATCGQTNYINPDNIIRIEAQSNYSKFYFDNGKTLLVAKVLGGFEDKLPKDIFIRTHRKHLVNKKFIESYNNGKISLVNLQKIDLARRKKKHFLNSWFNTQAS